MMKQTFRASLQGLLLDAEVAFASADAQIKSASNLTDEEIDTLQQLAFAAFGRREGIRASIAAWDRYLDSIKE